jgi:hypothetical protein
MRLILIFMAALLFDKPSNAFGENMEQKGFFKNRNGTIDYSVR